MIRIHRSIALLFIASLAVPAVAAEPSFRLPPVRKTDARAAAMDYGPVIATTLGVGPNNGIGNITPKGLVICIDKARQAHVCFDTELLRVSAAWTGERFNMQGRSFADNSDTFSFVESNPIFATARKPGWARGDEKADPRSPQDGPLPRDWARYRGLHVNGDRVVVSYVVGKTPVLEAFGVAGGDQALGVTRTLHIGASDTPMSLYVCELPQGHALLTPEPKAVPVMPAEHAAATVVSCTGGPADCRFSRDGQSVYLQIPAHAEPFTMKLIIANLPAADVGSFADLAPVDPEDLPALTKGGSARWTQTVTTTGKRGAGEGPYVVDDLGVPEPNPYKCWIRFTGMDFFPDGRSAALCTWNGDVWIVSGIDDKLEKLTWRRFAAGLHQPMGLKIVDGQVYANCRDQITRLHDRNGDGEADFHECFNNDVTLTTNFHEFSFDLQTDRDGNFYFGKGSAIWAGEQRRAAHNGTVLRVSKDGTKLDVLATGLRAPNGVGVGPNGEITASDNQGNWTPTSCVNLIRPGPDGAPLFYGYHHPGEKSVPNREPPLVWLPHWMDKSPGTQLWVPDERWGPLQGRMVEASYDTSLLLILCHQYQGGAQGAAIKLPVAFPSGTMRGRFNPADGQLYVCGLRGWSSRAAADACFQRVRYSGKPLHLPRDYVVHHDGIDLTFPAPIDPASVDPENIGAEWYNVVRAQGYGSNEFSANDPKKKGRDIVEIATARLSPDGKTVSLGIPGLKPVTNLVLKMKLKAADGSPVNIEMSCTINKVPQANAAARPLGR